MILRTLSLQEELDDLLRRLAFDANTSKGELMRNLITYALHKRGKIPAHLMKADWVKKAIKKRTKKQKKRY